MTITSFKAGTDPGLFRIELSDGSHFSFKSDYFPVILPEDDSGGFFIDVFVPGRELSTDEEAAFRFAAACLRVEKTALGLVARAEQCSLALSRKLEKRGCDSAAVKAVVAHLLDLNIVDDSRYARLWLQSRLRRRDSPRRLLAALCRRGIDHGEAEKHLRGLLSVEEEYNLLKKYLEKKRPAGTEREIRYFLKREGFSAAAIQIYREEDEV